MLFFFFFFFQAEDGIRDTSVTGVQTCAFRSDRDVGHSESFRGALVYPSLGVDVSNGPHRGRIYCSWMDLTPANATEIGRASCRERGGMLGDGGSWEQTMAGMAE